MSNSNPLAGDISSLLMHMPIPVCLFRGPDHIYELANEPYMQMINHRDVMGTSFRNAWPEAAQQEGLYALLDLVYTSGESRHIAELHAPLTRDADGNVEDTWLHLIFQPFRDEHGAVAGIVHMALDVTEQVRMRRTNEQLAQDLQIYKTMVDNAPDAVAVANLDGMITLANPAFQTMTGQGSNTIGKHIQTNIPPSEHETFRKSFAAIMEHGVWQGELLHQRADGSTFPTIVSTFMIYDEQNQPNAVAAFVRDITERKQMEEDIRQREERLRFILEGSRDGAWDTNLATGETYYSPRYAEMLGYQPDELEMTIDTWSSTMHPDDAPGVFQLFQDYLAGKTSVYETEFRMRHKSGAWLWVHARGKATVRDAEGKPVRMSGTMTDVSEQKRQDEERLVLQEQVIQAQQAALRELSSPLIPISDNVVLMPLIGSLDTARAQQVMETLLEGIATYRAEIAILDITGMQVVDTQVANALVQAAQAVKLLGAQVVLTGIGPTMAQTLVTLGADLSSIETRGRLQSGIAYALRT